VSKKGQKRINTYFRQTAKAFKAARQTAIFSHINRNITYRIYNFSKDVFVRQRQKFQSRFNNPSKFGKNSKDQITK